MFNFLKKRTLHPEMMDDFSVPTELLAKNLKELDRLNRTTRNSRAIIQQLIKHLGSNTQVYKIVDLGCGSGDLLKQIAIWGRKNNVTFKLIGIDNNPNVISYLENNCADFNEISGIVANVTECFNKTGEVDFIISSLFLHHLSNDHVIQLFGDLKKHVTMASIISDLDRNIFAYIGSWLIPRILNGTSLSKTDGPVSVLNAFKKKELIQLIHKANVSNFKIKTHFPIRHILTIFN